MTDQDWNPSHFRLLEHSGDLKIESTGEEYLEALANASSGLVKLIVENGEIQEAEQRSINVRGDDETSRTIAFLNELIYLIYTKRWLPKRVKWLKFCTSVGCDTLDGVLVGEPLDPARHQLKLDVKAVTYHEFEIARGAEGCTIRFVCDL